MRALDPSRGWQKSSHVDCLRRLFDEGYSAGQIADRMTCLFGMRYSRNAIIGKLHRLRLFRSPEELARCSACRRASRGKLGQAAKQPPAGNYLQARSIVKKMKCAIVKTTECPPVKVDMPAIPSAVAMAVSPPGMTRSSDITGVMLADRPRNSCCWPVTEDAPFLYCGQPGIRRKEGHGAYCEHHAAKMWAKVRRKGAA